MRSVETFADRAYSFADFGGLPDPVELQVLIRFTELHRGRAGMKLTSTDFATISSVLESIYPLQDLDEFVVTAMRILPPLINADISAYNEVSYSSRRMMTLIDAPRAQKLFHERQLHYEAMMHQNPLIEHSSRVVDGPKKISDFLTKRQWRATTIYREFYIRVHGEHQIAVVLPVPDNTIVAFAFNRGKKDFTERDRAMLLELQPHLTRAYLNAKTYTSTRGRLQRRERMLDTLDAGWIDFSADLDIIGATQQARSDLEAFFPRDIVDRGGLPATLKSWVTGNMEQAMAGVPVSPHVVRNQLGRLILRLIVSGDTGECSLLTERFLDALSPELLLRLGLSKRQAEVLYWVSQGKSNAEIAVVLKVSVRTVVHHVSKILEALGVANRTEAAKLAAIQVYAGGD